MIRFSTPGPFPLVDLAAVIGLSLLLLIVFSVPATAKPNKLKSRDKTEVI